jgi:hypothetical protein
MSRQTLIQLVPRSPAEPNGVADYALALARALSTYGITSVFLVAMPSAKGKINCDGWHAISLPVREPKYFAETIGSLATSTKAAAVLLHFSGYGYQRRGVPLWLLRGLKQWNRHQQTHVRLLTIFHELYATGLPWNSSCWLSPIQRLIARNILNLSSDTVTPTELYRDQLLHWNKRARVACMPVFSNVGEPGCGRPPCARPATAVIFGLSGVEDRLFGVYRSELARVVRIMGIKKIVDIGPRVGSPPASLADVPVVVKGALPPLAISELLQDARFGFVAYPFHVIGKSGVFAAYAAHGTIPVVFPDRRGHFDGLEAGRHFIDGPRIAAAIEASALGLIQLELFSWYASHSLQVQACALQRVINRDARA